MVGAPQGLKRLHEDDDLAEWRRYRRFGACPLTWDGRFRLSTGVTARLGAMVKPLADVAPSGPGSDRRTARQQAVFDTSAYYEIVYLA
jgi:hypothetical protein